MEGDLFCHAKCKSNCIWPGDMKVFAFVHVLFVTVDHGVDCFGLKQSFNLADKMH